MTSATSCHRRPCPKATRPTPGWSASVARPSLGQVRQAGAAGGGAAARRGAGAGTQARPRRLLPRVPRGAGAGPRGGEGGAGHQRPREVRPAAGAGPRLIGRVDHLLPHRPQPHRPGEEQSLPRPLPQRGDVEPARHRPRLPSRYPRPAHRARLRALGRRARGACRQLPHLPHPQRHPRRGQGARPAARRARSARQAGRGLRPRRWPRRGDGPLPRVRRPRRCSRLARPHRPGGAAFGLPASPQRARRRHGHRQHAARRAGARSPPPPGRGATSATGTRTASTTPAW